MVAKAADVVHAVDSSVLARELGKRALSAERARPLPVFIEANVSREPQKHGAAPSELAEVITAVQSEPALLLRGLMTMPPFGDPDAARRAFETLASLRSL